MAATSVPSDVRRIAVLRANSLGDYVFILPALAALRARYPGAEIVLLGKQWHAAFLAGRPGPVDRVEVVPRMQGIGASPAEPEDPAAVEDFFARMRAERFDIACQMFGGGRYSNPFVRRLGARLCVGLRAEDAPPLDRTVPYIYYHREVLRFLEVAALAGAPAVTLEPRIAVTERDRAEADRVLAPQGTPVAVLHPGASDTRRRWPAEKFALVGDALARCGAHVAVTGVPEEEETAAEVVRRMAMPALNLCSRLSLRGLAGLLARCAVLVANDTGPLHLARAVNAPTVGIYWVGNHVNAGPMTLERHRFHLSWRLTCPECGTNCITSSCTHRPSFVADVPAGEVIRSAEELFTSRVQEKG